LIRPENYPFNLPAEIICHTPEETETLGKCFSLFLVKGSVAALRGPLGAGKTCFTKGIARGLGITEEITSPTYTIVSEYEAVLSGGETVPFYHIDAYRLKGDDDFSAIGGEEIIFGGGVSVIEWSENIPGFIPAHALNVDFEIKESGERLVRIYRSGT
jgi:tRNA threonylcarbamoyladenosine biosynthesis protein TsaE